MDATFNTEQQQKIRKNVFVSLNPAVPTEVFDSFWRFAAERQEIFFARAKGARQPWSEDPILSTFKFTNAYRASDRVSQYLIKRVIYGDNRNQLDLDDVFFRILLFKLFNKIATWEMLKGQLGEPAWESYRYSDYDRLLSNTLRRGATIYSAAYIMASGHEHFGVERKHQSHLKLIELMIAERVPQRLRDCRTMRSGFELLRSYPLIGDFLAYQLITDINYSELTSFSEMEFTMPGPGARDGIRKCFSSLGGLSEAEIIRLMTERQEYEFDRLGLRFQNLWGRSLQLIDVQNLFCEVDKYARVKHPNVAGVSGRTRIKQRFRETVDRIEYSYPPKWGITVPAPEFIPSPSECQQMLF